MTDADAAAAGRYRIGLDLGSTASKGVILGPDGAVLAREIVPSGHTPAETAARLAERLTGGLDVPPDRLGAVATGYGRNMASLAQKKITEITCHAKGVRHLHPDAASILDIGGQDAKAIRLGPDGGVMDFAMNDRCAAGTGRFLEVAARRFDLGVEELSAFCLDDPVGDGDGPELEISSTCVVFAESELVGLAARGVPPIDALRAVHRAIARRVILLLKQVGATEPVYFTGGVAQNETLRRAVAAAAGMEVRTAASPQFTGAIGAALLA